MENIYKYTSDNKKVVVIGELNSKETIVQEIFIVNEKEVPSGEHFVVKSLHDQPVISWKEQQGMDLEKSLEQRKKKIKQDLEKIEKQQKQLEQIIRSNAQMIEKISPESFELLCNFLGGKITHIVEGRYRPKILTFEDFNFRNDSYKELKLISFFGNDNGTLQTYIHQYSDYSGSKDEIWLFTSLEGAVKKLIEFLKEQPISEERLKIAQEYGYSYPEEIFEEFKKEQVKRCEARLQKQKEELELFNRNLENLKEFGFVKKR